MFRAIAFIAAILITAVCSVPQAFAEKFPMRKAGLWELKRTIVGKPAGTAPMYQCVDKGSDLEMQKLAQSYGKGKCTKHDVKKIGTGMVVDSICILGSSTVTTKSEISGDFSSAYTIKISSKYEPAFMGMKAAQSELDARYLGECKADQRPGDVILPNGAKINVKDGNPGK